MNLIESLISVQDARRLQGQRYSSVWLQLIIIMGILRGHYGYRTIGRFCSNNASYLIKRFGFKNGKVLSYVTVREFIKSTDFASIQWAFHRWTQNYVPIASGDWIAIDGKSIRSTVRDYSSEYQNFVSLVSLFSKKRARRKTGKQERQRMSDS